MLEFLVLVLVNQEHSILVVVLLTKTEVSSTFSSSNFIMNQFTPRYF